MLHHSLLACALIVGATTTANAHFVWLTAEGDHALLFFSEGVHERDYHTPECVQQAEVTAGAGDAVAMKLVEEEGYTGMKSQAAVEDDAPLATQITYGAYHGTLLEYYARSAPLTDATPSAESLAMPLDAAPFRTNLGVGVLVGWHGQPAEGVEVSLLSADGKPTNATTDPRGVARFDNPPTGQLGFLIGHQEEAQGEVDGSAYQSKSHYLTLTTDYLPAALPPAGPALPQLPAAVASFGAAVCDGWLYVYSGHTGEEHVHSKENLSTHFCRVPLDGGAAWEELPMGPPLQGLPLVAHRGKLYRVGGLNHRNAADQDEDMHSTAEVACFDPATGEWTQLPSLPAPRSSHDAVVIGDQLYVVGGWRLAGASPGEWQTDALRLDLNDPASGWQPIEQPFERRALAAAQLDGKLVVLGGMQHDQGVTRAVSSWDPTTGEWSELPDLPGRAGGFGVSAWNLDGQLYACGMEGVLYALAPGADDWRRVAKLSDARFFHRLLPGDPGELLVVAGASTEDGHTGTVMRVKLPE